MTFKQGESGNPSGRPKGIVDKRSEFRKLLEPHAQGLVEQLIKLAKSGDPTALKLCIERLIPRVKPDNLINFELPQGMLDDPDVTLKIAHEITYAVANGELTINDAEKFTNLIGEMRSTILNAKFRKKDSE